MDAGTGRAEQDGESGSGGTRVVATGGTAGDAAVGGTSGVGGDEGLVFERLVHQLPGSLDASEVQSGDFDSDGFPDLVVLQSGLALFVLPGHRDGTFGSPPEVETAHDISGWSDITVGDFDADGWLDAATVVERSGYLIASLGAGDGTFRESVATELDEFGVQWGAICVDTADFDGDAITDVAVCSDIPVMLAEGDGSFRFADTGAGINDTAVPGGDLAIADFDRDQHLDLVSWNMIFFGRGGGVLEQTGWTGETCERLAAADVNEDGYVDLVGSSSENMLSVMFNDGTGYLGDYDYWRLEEEFVLLGASDMNLDGHVDVLLGTTNFELEVRFGLGDGTFRDGIVVALADTAQFHKIAIDDFDADGRVDLALAAGRHLEVLLNRLR